jgi:serine/threonine-protein phosphatase 2A activator
MYNAEVLSKFPVVQHFPFGSLFSWEQDPNATLVETSIHTSNQPAGRPSQPQEGTRAPWANTSGTTASRVPPQGIPGMRAPWAAAKPLTEGRIVPSHQTIGDGPTKAPWAKDHNAR